MTKAKKKIPILFKKSRLEAKKKLFMFQKGNKRVEHFTKGQGHNIYPYRKKTSISRNKNVDKTTSSISYGLEKMSMKLESTTNPATERLLKMETQNPSQDYHYQNMSSSEEGSISLYHKAKTNAATRRNIPKDEDTPANNTTKRTNTEKPQLDETHEVENIVYRDRNNEFEQRKERLLNTEGNSFLKACCTLIVHLDTEKSAYEVKKQYGDKLLNDVQVFYQRVELARQYCLEALEPQERLEDKHTKYMQCMFGNLFTCERVHKMYFEEQEESQIIRQQQIQYLKPQEQIQPQNISCSVAESLIKPNIVTKELEPRIAIPGSPPNILEKMIPTMHHPYPASLDPKLDQNQNWMGQNQQSDLFQQQQYQRTPTATSVIGTQHDHISFNLNELGLREKLDGPQANKPNHTCIFCNKTSHRYQLHCKQLKNMTPNQIYKVMTISGIDCKMCLGLGHKTKNCPAIKEGPLKKCHIKEDGKECQKYHCLYLHKHKRKDEATKSPKTNQMSNQSSSHNKVEDLNYDKIQKQFQQIFKFIENHRTKK